MNGMDKRTKWVIEQNFSDQQKGSETKEGMIK